MPILIATSASVYLMLPQSLFYAAMPPDAARCFFALRKRLRYAETRARYFEVSDELPRQNMPCGKRGAMPSCRHE